MSRRRPARTPAPPPPPPPSAARRWPWAVAAVALAVVAAGALLWLRRTDGETPRSAQVHAAVEATPSFVGSAVCADCHAEAYDAWRGSQHARAMQAPSEETVLGDFSGVRFAADGESTTFLRRDSLYLVRTRGPGGGEGEFPVRFTFGVYPLQQYLIELPGGRLQALSVAWDARERSAGGQRWMTLYPGQRIEHTDELHWSGRQQNWNFMCADCHSTDVRKGYDRAADTFRTTWSEPHVGCEGCHGPGSRHLAVVSGEAGDAPASGLTAELDERRGVTWTVGPDGLPRRSEPRTGQREIEVCAQCHSRRAQIAEGYVPGNPLTDQYLPSLLVAGLYHPDGQQLDEVYTWGSFLQSRMFAAGVTCSDCHEPHGGRLRAEGNAVCTTCHTPARYDGPGHHFHPGGGEAARCVSCHMPATTYMRIDPRRDHSLRVPRPDRTVDIGVPNACNGCHTDRSPAWAAAAVSEWYGRDAGGFQHFAEAFAAHQAGEAGADSALAALATDAATPAIVRASALARLAERPARAALDAARAGIFDADPLARRAALQVAEGLPPAERLTLATPLLSDPSRAVRQQAAWALAPAAGSLQGAGVHAAFTRASNEFIASQRYLADRPENRVTLGTFFAQLGRFGEAEAEYTAALRMRPAEVTAYVNLADLYRTQRREGEAEQLLRRGLEVVPDEPNLHHALGLSLARAGRTAEAREQLGRAAELAPEEPRFAYAHAVALHSTGDVPAAVRALEAALQRHPADYDLLFALATFHRDAGRMAEARAAATRLREAHPDDPTAARLLQSLQ